MRRFLYHIVRILAILVLVAIYAALLYIIADKGKWGKALFVGALGLVSLFTFAHWLYSGFFIRRSFRGYLSWFMKYRFRKHYKSALIGYTVGCCVVVAIRFALGHNPLAEPSFYVILLGFGLLLLLSNILSGYIKYCYRRNGYQGK